MFIHFNEKELHLQTICGILENYKPSKEVKSIHKKVDKLKKKIEKFYEEIDPDLIEIREMIAEENKKYSLEEK